MLSIEKCEILPGSFVASFQEKGYADSYRTEINRNISMEEYVYSFYTSPLFKLERFILTWTVLKPSTDSDANELAKGNTTKFAAWTVENRSENELLMCDFVKRTRSWFMVNHTGTIDKPNTQLYFGTGISSSTKRKSIGLFFTLLLPFHKVYSRFLLHFAKRKLSRSTIRLRDYETR